MGRFLMLALLLSNVTLLSAQEAPDADKEKSPWRLEYQMMMGNSRVFEIEDIEQPKVGTVSQSGTFALGLEYRLGDDWSLYSGLHMNFRQGQAWADGTPFELQENGLDIPLMLRTDSWSPLAGILPTVAFQVGIGVSYGMLFSMKAHEIPGVSQPRAIGADADFFDYHHLALLAELRFRVRISERDEVSVGVHTLQDLLTFGAADNQPIVPKFQIGGISIGYSRPIF